MRLVNTNHIELSERNLVALLQDYRRNGSTNIRRYDEEAGEHITVSVRPDSDHYGDREPGWMPFDEASLKA